jgi:N-acetylglucosamine-6-phosphate deacetylase
MDIDVGDDGIARIPGQPFLAGSTLTPFEGVFYAAQMNGAPWQEMWDAFSVRPARWLGIKHGLELGNEASFCLLNPDPNPQLAATYSRGALASEN